MDKDKETLQTWNKVADLYRDTFMLLDIYDESYKCFCESIKSSRSKILEIGCGPGNITKYLLLKRPDFDVFAIDYAPQMVDLAKLANPGVKFAVMDGRKINQIQDKYDGIVCGFLLPYLSADELRTFLKDCKNLLNIDGWLYVSFVAGESENSGFKTGSTGDRTYFYYHTIEAVEALLAENQFTGSKVFQVNFLKSDDTTEIHTIIIVRKS